MYELKKNRKVFTSKFVGTGPSSYEKRIYRAAVSQRLRNAVLYNGHDFSYPGKKWPGFGFDQTAPPSAWVKDEYNYTSTLRSVLPLAC